jgi:hypothetical protein
MIENYEVFYARAHIMRGRENKQRKEGESDKLEEIIWEASAR